MRTRTEYHREKNYIKIERKDKQSVEVCKKYIYNGVKYAHKHTIFNLYEIIINCKLA